MCVCMCNCVCIYVCVVCTCIYMYVFVYVCMCLCARMPMCASDGYGCTTQAPEKKDARSPDLSLCTSLL